MNLEIMLIPYTFLIGACIGSFLNVVIYRLPRGKSLGKPRSYCPKCGKAIPFYLNIPIVSWFALRGKCRYCKAPISPRYVIIEALTASVFAGVYICYFIIQTRAVGTADGGRAFINGHWWIYASHIILFAAFIAASAIDLELWIIPLSLCWFVTAVGVVFSTFGGYFVLPQVLEKTSLVPFASPETAAVALGGIIGLCFSLILLKKGLIRRSYQGLGEVIEERIDSGDNEEVEEPEFNDRVEMLKEVVFLLPPAAVAMIVFFFLKESSAWADFCGNIYVKSFFGSIYGYLIGCFTVWATRILGTLGFGREAMGLGDVHLLGAAGAVIGAAPAATAFFIAPFFGLIWAAIGIFLKKGREIPYGPFLSLAVFLVMIFKDPLMSRVYELFGI